MSQRFIRCAHCGLPHDVTQTVCPATGKAMDRRRYNTSSIPARTDLAPSPQQPARPRPHSDPPPPPPRQQNPLPSTLPPRPPHRDLIGKTIGNRYTIRSVLGEGGMGAVYEAENLALGRLVAVKVLHPAQAKKKIAVKRFHQEARAAGAIGHPNICEVYDLGTLEDGAPYLVMERLVGETLADRIASEGGLPFDDVIDFTTQVLSGLVAAHEKGIVHRDIKPENVFLTKRVGCPPLAKLLDFGVSKMIAPIFGNEKEEDLDLTRTGMVMGTPFYMSPEQARGDRNLDARVDLYACGVILYEAITGKRPYTAANYNALLLQILTTRPRPARELRPALPQGFDEVLDKSLARSRDERYQSAAEFQRDLQQLRDRHPKTSVGMDVSEMARQAAQLRRSTPLVPLQPTPSRQPTPAAFQPPPPEPPEWRDEPAPDSEPTPSSVEIPILFSDTPMSGEEYPNLGTADLELIAMSDPTAIQERPAEMSRRDPPISVADRTDRFPTSSDTDTTERRVDLASFGIGKRPRAGALRPGPRVERRLEFKASSDTEVDDNNATLIQPSPLRRRTKGPSPDDTIRMDGEGTSDVRDARDRLPSSPPEPIVPRAPKLPRT